MHSVRIEPTKLILVGTRTTYQATGECYVVYMYQYVFVVLHEIDCVIGYLR